MVEKRVGGIEIFPYSSLPEGWAVAIIEDLISGEGIITDGDWIESKDQDPNGDVRLIQLADVGDGVFLNKSSRYLTLEKAVELNCTFLDDEDLLISRLGEPLGKACILPKQDYLSVTAVDVVVFRSGSKHISHRWLMSIINSPIVRAMIDSQKSGTTRKRITGKKIKNLPIPVPPYKEQKRIASRIDAFFSAIEKGEAELKRIQSLIQRYRQSVLKAAVTGELTREWREKNAGKLESGEALLDRILRARRKAWENAELEKMRAKGQKPKDDKWKIKYKEPKAPETSNLSELPEGWAWATFFQIGEFGRGKSKHRPRNDLKLYGGKYPFFQTGTVRNSNGRIKTYDNTYNDIGLAQSKLWPKGTVCITIAANIAESGILEFDGCFPDSIVGLVPAEGVVGEYIEFFIRTVRSQLDSYAPATAQKNINLGILEEVAIPLPPTDEQKDIFSKAREAMSNVDFIQNEINSAFGQAAAMRRSILKDAFEGKLVFQDPNNEPASELLKRIFEERDKPKPNNSKPRVGRKRKSRSAKK